MKSTPLCTKNRTVGLCILMATLLCGSVIGKADVVLDWNAIAVSTAVANTQNPFAQARYAAIVQLAIFEAVNSITRQYQPYLGAITAAPGALPDAAAIEAVYQVLSAYFPASQPTLYADCAERGLISQPEDGSPPRATTSSNYGPWYMIGEPARASNLLFKSL